MVLPVYLQAQMYDQALELCLVGTAASEGYV